ncbi:MAG: phosphate ABC transporter permease subunit PstC [Armatimonadota bacterium]
MGVVGLEDTAVGTEVRTVRSTKTADKVKSELIARFIWANGALAILAMVLIFVFLIKDAFPLFKSLSDARAFFAGTDWQPEFGNFGVLPLLAGSIAVTLGAVVIAVPVGVLCAIYIAEFAPRAVREVLKPTVEVLAGIPSVVLGFIGLTITAPYLQKLLHMPTGLTALTGAVMLGFMALPTIISIAEDALVAVPGSYREGSLALGATHWETVHRVLVPAAKSGIVAACMLGVGRAVGETMTVLMVAGNAGNLPQSLSGIVPFFLGPVRTMTATIASDMGETVCNSPHYHALFAVGLTLFAITFAINLIADLIIGKSREMR